MCIHSNSLKENTEIPNGKNSGFIDSVKILCSHTMQQVEQVHLLHIFFEQIQNCSVVTHLQLV
jgi:hypothetical protein